MKKGFHAIVPSFIADDLDSTKNLLRENGCDISKESKNSFISWNPTGTSSISSNPIK